MPLRGNDQSEHATNRTDTVLQGIKNFSAVKSTTEVVHFRIPQGEKERLKALFAKKGFTLSEAIKIAVYRFAEEIESGKANLLNTRKNGNEL